MTNSLLRKYIDIVNEANFPSATQPQVRPASKEYKELVTFWDQLANSNPELKLALDMLPPTAFAMSAGDTANALAKKSYGDAAVNALGLIPGVKPIVIFTNKIRNLITPQQWAQHLKIVQNVHSTARAVDTGNDLNDYRNRSTSTTTTPNPSNTFNPL